MKRIVIISDTHNNQDKILIPKCDILIHCGDATTYGTVQEIGHFLNWFEEQNATIKIFVPGNHDMYMEEYKSQKIDKFEILIDRLFIYEGISFFGSPWRSRPKDITINTSIGFDAFSVLYSDIYNKRKLIPSVDILITHYPPFGILDRVEKVKHGCEALQKRTQEVDFKLHCFGHVHSGYGVFLFEDRTFINAAMCDENNILTKLPVVIDYDEKTKLARFCDYYNSF